MPNIKVNSDGSISAAKNRAEIIDYYAAQIDRRLDTMLKLMALGADVGPVRERIVGLNNEKKQKLQEGQ